MAKDTVGYVYILTNPSFREDWVKIGKTQNLKERLKALDNTSCPLPFDVYATLRTTRYDEAEEFVHEFISHFNQSLRVRPNREYFKVAPEEALSILYRVKTMMNEPGAEIMVTNERGRKLVKQLEKKHSKQTDNTEDYTTPIPNKGQKHNSTQYSIDGGPMLGKRQFVYQLVKTYLKQKPKTSFAQLEQIFKPNLQGSYGVIRTTIFIKEKGYVGNRFFMKDNELLRSGDGLEFAVCSQWDIGNIPQMIELSKKLGFTINTSEDKNNSTPSHVSQKGGIRCVIRRNSDAFGIFDFNTHYLTVLKGSRINPNHLPGVEEINKNKREILMSKYTVIKNGEVIVKKDVVFKSPSAAAAFCVGGSSNGWRDWKDENNNEIAIYRKLQD